MSPARPHSSRSPHLLTPRPPPRPQVSDAKVEEDVRRSFVKQRVEETKTVKSTKAQQMRHELRTLKAFRAELVRDSAC